MLRRKRARFEERAKRFCVAQTGFAFDEIHGAAYSRRRVRVAEDRRRERRASPAHAITRLHHSLIERETRVLSLTPGQHSELAFWAFFSRPIWLTNRRVVTTKRSFWLGLEFARIRN
jgi:hypothetical protein